MRDTGYFVPASKNSRVATAHQPDANGELVESPNPAEIRSGVNGDITPDGTRLISERSLRIMGQNQLGDVKVSLQQEPSRIAPELFRKARAATALDWAIK